MSIGISQSQNRLSKNQLKNQNTNKHIVDYTLTENVSLNQLISVYFNHTYVPLKTAVLIPLVIACMRSLLDIEEVGKEMYLSIGNAISGCSLVDGVSVKEMSIECTLPP